MQSLVRREIQPLRKLAIALVSLGCLVISGCYHVRVIAPHPDPATEYKQKTTNTLAWGLIKEDVAANDCSPSNAVDEVRVSSNFGNNLLTVFTLGFWSRTTVQWRCSKPHEHTDTISSIEGNGQSKGGTLQ